MLARDLPTPVLRAEGAALLGVSIFLYARYGDGWLLFVLLILAPDLSMLGYVGGPVSGAVAYNLAHTTVLPLLLAVVGVVMGGVATLSVALIWMAHIGMDRAMGYGLKRTTGFRDTHLGRVGRR